MSLCVRAGRTSTAFENSARLSSSSPLVSNLTKADLNAEHMPLSNAAQRNEKYRYSSSEISRAGARESRHAQHIFS